MRRSLILILALSFPLLMSAKVFAADPDPITTSPTASASNETQIELTTLQTAIKEDIARLAQYQGELRTIVEYRIQNKTFPNSTAKCDTRQYQAANTISLKTIAG
ncbi:hypothetical protein K5M77_17690, partial [Shewanella xiamenensis]|nr:hypothetical protein [Shewanella xiamenensis]